MKNLLIRLFILSSILILFSCDENDDPCVVGCSLEQALSATDEDACTTAGGTWASDTCIQAFDDESSCTTAGGDWEDCVVEEAVATDSGGDTGGTDGGEVLMSEC